VEASRLRDLLDAALATLQKFADRETVTERVDLTESFMSQLFDLGLALGRDPQDRSSPEFERFLQESAALLPRAVGDLCLYVVRTENLFYGTWEYDEWKQVCRRRSTLEFLWELYRETEFSEWFEQIELEDLDNLLEERGKREGYLPVEDIPEGVPRAHWWWWHPEEPPTAA